MKYVSIDLETTGLEKDRYQILSFGAIIEDTENKLPLTEIPKFHAAILHSELTGSPFAFNMNKKILRKMAKVYHNNSFTEEVMEMEEFQTLYESVVI